MNFVKRKNRKGDRITFYYDFGRKAGQRPTTGIFIYTKPQDLAERNHNKEALSLLKVKESQVILDRGAFGTAFIPTHKFKSNFIDYFEEYAKQNKRKGNRHLANCLKHFKSFVGNGFISPVDITDNFCKRFRQYLLDKFTGETPGNYFARFKWVVNAAKKEGYFRDSPVEDISSKSNPSVRIKENLESEEYIKLLNTPCFNENVRDAFIFSCYTGLRWVDVSRLCWSDINGSVLITRIIQKKTGRPVTLTLHPIARAILDRRLKHALNINCTKSKVFILPCHDGANKVLSKWVECAGIPKHISWSCARLSFSILLQDKKVDDATVAYLMGHTTTAQVQKTYKRHRPKDQTHTISHLPSPEFIPYFLDTHNTK